MSISRPRWTFSKKSGYNFLLSLIQHGLDTVIEFRFVYKKLNDREGSRLCVQYRVAEIEQPIRAFVLNYSGQIVNTCKSSEARDCRSRLDVT